MDGRIYGTTNSGDGFVIANGRLQVFLSHTDPMHGVITCMYPDPVSPGYVYVESDYGIVIHADVEDFENTMSLIEMGTLSQCMAISYVNNRLWFCCRNGIGIMDRGQVRALENVPMNNPITKVTSDYEGNLWFASTRQGVMKIVPNQFTDIFEKYHLEERVVNSTCMLDDQLYIATDNGLIVFDSDGNRVESIPVTEVAYPDGHSFADEGVTLNLIDMLYNVRIRSITKDSKDRLWFAAWRQYGVLRYDHGKVMLFTEADGMFSNNVRKISECPDGSYVAALTGGVNIIKDDEIGRAHV